MLENIGEISKPASVLIEKISEAVGGYFKPFQIKRVAKAEAEVEILKAQTQIEITALQSRAIGRFVTEEGKKQENIEDIVNKTIPLLTDSSEPQKMDDDWITNFFDKCRIISDQEMQSLWAKVLAGEANTPGTFSKRTVNFLSSLDNADAHLFTRLCGFGLFLNDLCPLVYDTDTPIYKDHGITFSSLSHLDDIGLVSFLPEGFSNTENPKTITVYYYGKPLRIEFKNSENNELDIGFIILTKIGQQLAPLCGSQPIDGFLDFIVDRWTKEGLILTSPYPAL